MPDQISGGNLLTVVVYHAMAAHIGQRTKSTRERHQTHTDAIETTKVLKRLQDHIVGNQKLSSTQVRAAEILLRKTLPDLRSSEHTTDPAAPPVYHVIKSKSD